MCQFSRWKLWSQTNCHQYAVSINDILTALICTHVLCKYRSNRLLIIFKCIFILCKFQILFFNPKVTDSVEVIVNITAPVSSVFLFLPFASLLWVPDWHRNWHILSQRLSVTSSASAFSLSHLICVCIQLTLYEPLMFSPDCQLVSWASQLLYERQRSFKVWAD